MSISSKIPFLEIAKNADDQTVLKMLQVNRFFNNPEFFQILFKNRYPYLIQFKKDYEDWRSFYVRMIYYISKLKEDFDFVYVPVKSTNPEMLYKTLLRNQKLYSADSADVFKKGHLIKFMIENGYKNEDIMEEYLLLNEMNDEDSIEDANREIEIVAIENGYIELFEKKDNEYYWDQKLMEAAIKSKNPKIIEYVERKSGEKITERYYLDAFAQMGDIESIEKIYNYPRNEWSILLGAVEGGQLNVLKKYIPKTMDTDDLTEFLSIAVKNDHLEILQFLVNYAEKKKKIYKYLKSQLKHKYVIMSDIMRKYIKSILPEKYKTKKDQRSKDEKKKQKLLDKRKGKK